MITCLVAMGRVFYLQNFLLLFGLPASASPAIGSVVGMAGMAGGLQKVKAQLSDKTIITPQKEGLFNYYS